ncbi:hypothetical protein U6G28_02535 [Actinomycetaceae bacterium MB13-C1-2]|nr:hypothetical protein U6G28_02535 [Actinomycetaceae bacterium MB13-C1-2]
MSTIPEAAVEAAAEELFYAEDEALGYPRELRRWEAQYPDQDGDWHDYWRDRARVTLEAAAPHIRAQIAEEIREIEEGTHNGGTAINGFVSTGEEWGNGMLDAAEIVKGTARIAERSGE